LEVINPTILLLILVFRSGFGSGGADCDSNPLDGGDYQLRRL
jgi:hypothetical protein